MPIFEYVCSKCGEHFEELLLSSSPEVVCPFCHSPKVGKILSTFAVSSDGTRGRATRDVRKRNSELRLDYGHEETRRLKQHEDDHL